MINYILKQIVYYMIHSRLFSNYNKFKVGDIVAYNWRTKYYINSVWRRERSNKRITKITSFRDGTQLCEYEPINPTPEEYSSGCDVFWLRKVKPIKQAV